MNLEPFKPKPVQEQIEDAAWNYVAAVTSRENVWIGYTRTDARRAAKFYPKQFAANCRDALGLIGRNLRYENHR